MDEAVRTTVAVARALDYAHRHGVVHRDIKPANILLLDVRPVIADFGIALAVSASGADRLTATGFSLGTPLYMSPEQAMRERNVGAATDIYALGCVLYEMLVGEPPYTGSTAQAILAKIITADPVPAAAQRKTVPANVDPAIRKALEKLPADRFATASDFAKALDLPSYRDELAKVPPDVRRATETDLDRARGGHPSARALQRLVPYVASLLRNSCSSALRRDSGRQSAAAQCARRRCRAFSSRVDGLPACRNRAGEQGATSRAAASAPETARLRSGGSPRRSRA